MEAERFVLNNSFVKLESACLQSLAASRMAGIEDRHIVFLRHFVNRREKACEILFRVDIFLAMSGKKNILSLFKSEAGMDIACLNFGEIVMKHLCHRGTCYICSLFRQSAIGKIAACVLGVCHINIRNDVNNPAVCLLRQALILAAVSGFHMEDRNVQSLCPDNGETAVRITENKHCIRLDFRHERIGFCDNIAAGLTEI